MTNLTLINTENASPVFRTNRTTGKAYRRGGELRLPNHQVPWRFRDSRSYRFKQAREKLQIDGPMRRALRTMREPALYSLDVVKHLGLSEHYARAGGIFDAATVEVIRSKLRELFDGCVYLVVEVGSEMQTHVHLVADLWAGLRHLSRFGEIVKPIKRTEEDLERVVAYLHKGLPKNAELIRAHQKAQAKERLPRTRGYLRLPRQKATSNYREWTTRGFRKNVRESAAAMKRRRLLGCSDKVITPKPKPSYANFYRDSPTEWDIGAVLGMQFSPKHKRRLQTKPLRA